MPPPPPPAPPPLPKIGGASSNTKSNNFDPPPDRNALLSQIRKGARLKKAETNDRSAPLVNGGGGKSSSNGAAVRQQNTDSKSNASSSSYPIIPPGGLFAQGIPKLRPTVPKSGDNPALSAIIQSLKTGKSSSLDHLRVGQLSGSRSQPPSPVSKPRSSVASSQANDIHSNAGGNPNFPDDVNIKGPAPAPPPASQKPVFRSNTGSEPSKLTTVKRSASQTNLGQRPRLTRPPPNVKPPPPPKGNPPPPQSAPPPPPSKPPNIMRRQSFGVGEGQNLRLASNKLTGSSTVSKAIGKSIGPPPPPPPPRNNSAPHDLNQMVTSSSPSSHLNKMNIAPPPPPNRIMASGNRAAPIRPPPRAPAPPPPPPPQHQFGGHPAPPSQLKAMPSMNAAPPPPARVSSMKTSSEFEDRFKFHPAQSLPKPDRFSNSTKNYPSKANQVRQKQNTRRQPPPPPPMASTNVTGSQPVLHIQLESGIFSNNFAHS
ncbi:WAS/WASL-interacting protein family member 1 [Parasteatoda tepidariorum]|uniref:WAS/WASL-interacting protein family member 1 n=1 Tax=Parasteatoda tepidariorum TaxID=114398 RepID=UPI001C72501C|nr:WAS/WASL-interacting protein family member 1 [Parasteatoda tepidariorum]XP_015914659.2 WAS/WASL-interacting protein family member 1 [Parasteatoda tepidariorum]